jgi:flagellar protein FlaF
MEKKTQSGRETEARVLTQGALMLRDCQRNWDATDYRDRLDAALKYNQKIWSIFQVELASPENPLPIDIKRNLMQLSRYVDKRIFDTMAFPKPEKLDIIIKINQNIAAGLRGSTTPPIN